tara:strand:+ start:312 stop:683 length:372 start_codon:yes stop_codon:yes gene_type:complete
MGFKHYGFFSPVHHHLTTILLFQIFRGGGLKYKFMNIDKINCLSFWENYPDIILIKLPGGWYLQADEAEIILSEFKLKFSDKLYESDKTKLISTIISNDIVTPNIEHTYTLFLPLECLTSFIF